MRPFFEYYVANLDRWPLEVGVDLTLHDKAPIEGMKYRAHFRLTLNHPTPDGLACQEESALLLAIEEEVLAALQPGSFCFVANVTHRERRTIVLYLDAEPAPGHPILEAIQRVETHKTLFQFEVDPDWEEYLGFLYPSEAFRHQIKDRRILKEFEKRGDDPARTHSLEPAFSGFDEEAAKGFSTALEQAGFVVGEVSDISINGVANWRVVGAVKSPLALSILDDHRGVWMKLAEDHGGRYEGWSAEVLPIGEGDGPASQ